MDAEEATTTTRKQHSPKFQAKVAAPAHPEISMPRQRERLGLNRSELYYQPSRNSRL